jgi:hypothetical protein
MPSEAAEAQLDGGARAVTDARWFEELKARVPIN